MSLFPIAEESTIEKTVHHVLIDHDLQVLTPMLDDILLRFEKLEMEMRSLKGFVRRETQA